MGKKNKNKNSLDSSVTNSETESTIKLEGSFDEECFSDLSESITDPETLRSLADSIEYVGPATEELIDLMTACQRYLNGFKFGWFHGIKKHAESHGMGLLHTPEEWKKVLRSWGGQVH